jgi:thiamine biosynthesis protein ThiS
MLDVLVNGETRRVPEGWTVLDLLGELGRHPRTVAVEHNGEILARERYGATPLENADRLEIVGFVQGGSGGPRAGLRSGSRGGIPAPRRRLSTPERGAPGGVASRRPLG